MKASRKVEFAPMPELPEVETVARGAHEMAAGARIGSVWFASYSRLFKNPAEVQARGLEGRRLLGVHREGKHIVCELGGREGRSKKVEAQWIVHLGMTGRLLVADSGLPVAAHTHARLDLDRGRELRFVDPRRFGRLEYRDLAVDGPFRAAGAEPLTVTGEEFFRLFHRRQMPVKAALLNQNLLSGVGNIYADESLFRAGIRPRRLAARLTRIELERLRLSLVEVLEAAIRAGGSSVSDYVDARGEHGFFQLEHCVYQRTGKACRQCGEAIRRIELAGRGTHFCAKCQR